MGKKSGMRDSEQLRERRMRLEQEAKEKQRRQNRIVYGTLGAFLGLILIAVLITVIVTQTGKKKGNTETNTETNPGTTAPTMDQIDLSDVADASVFTISENETDYVRLTVSYTTSAGTSESGDIYIRLFPDVAPKTVANFKSLVASGFYNGLTFHRIMPNFMIQGGDPNGNGTGDSGTTIQGEFTANGFENNLKHIRGVVSMARGSQSMDSASCQFFIMHADYPSLNGNYASFGYVVNGMDVVDAITQIELVEIDSQTKSPVHPVTITSAVFVTK